MYRTIFLVFTLVCSLILFLGCTAEEISYPDPILPGEIPEIFAEGILPQGVSIHTAVTFGMQGREMYWHEIPPRMMFIERLEEGWSNPVTPEFAREISSLQPFFQANGNRLYFVSNMPGGEGGMDIWFVDRTLEGWGKPENAGAPINTENNEMQPSLSAKGAMYYVARIPGKMFERGIFRTRAAGGQFLMRIRLPKPVNTEKFIDYTPCIAPDESFLLFSSNRQNPDTEFCQIYVTFPQGMGIWSEPVNVCRELGFVWDARFPALSPDGKYLFFCGEKNMYWMDAAVIQKIKKRVLDRKLP